MKEIREKLCITQQLLADFLQVERSRLSRLEAGYRHLPDNAVQKLLKVEAVINKPAASQNSAFAKEELQKLDKQVQRKMKNSLLNYNYRAEKAKREMEKMQAVYQASLLALAYIQTIMRKNADTYSGADKHILCMMEKQVLKKIKNNNPALQAIQKARYQGYKTMSFNMQQAIEGL